MDLQERGILGTVLTSESEDDKSEDGNENTGLNGHSKQNGGAHKRKSSHTETNGSKRPGSLWKKNN